MDRVLNMLQESKENREERRALSLKENVNEETVDPINLLWAKNLAQQVSELTNERERKLLKVKIQQLVSEAQMKDLSSE